MSRKFAIIGCVVLLGVGTIVWSTVRRVECYRVTSPDGRFYAVATCRAWRFQVPMPPGSSGDKPGYVTVFSRDGHSYGSAALNMIREVHDITWSHTNAELPLVAEWDLVHCRIHVWH